jgi:hypothetical protein
VRDSINAAITSPAAIISGLGREETLKARIKGFFSVPGSGVARGVCVGVGNCMRVGVAVGVPDISWTGNVHPRIVRESIRNIFFIGEIVCSQSYYVAIIRQVTKGNL